MVSIAFIGLPGAGKSSLSKALHNETKSSYVPEIARLYIKSCNRTPTKTDQHMITKLQSKLETELGHSQLTICDLPICLCKYFEHVNFGKEVSLDVENTFYDIIFYIQSFNYVKDGVRYQSDKDLDKLRVLIEHDAHNHCKHLIKIKSIEWKDKLSTIKKHVREFKNAI